MHRRDALKAAVGSAAFLAGSAMAAEDHMFHKHVEFANANEDLVSKARDCARTGEACLKVCLEVLETGDTSMAACAKSVRELIFACDALAGMAVHDSRHLAEYAALTSKVCTDCREQCLKHKEHSQCLDCANSCEACIEACKRFSA